MAQRHNNPHSVLLNVTDNTSALSWTTGACQKSKIGCPLARLFCSLLINSPLGVNSQWINTIANEIADDISRVKKLLQQTSKSSHLLFDYISLKQRYPELKNCSFFQIHPELILLIWEIVLTKKWPCHNKIKRLQQRPCGKLISSCGQE